MSVKFPYGNKEVSVEIPKNSKTVSVLVQKEIQPVKNEAAEIEEALNNPIGIQNIKKLAKGKRNAVIMVDDWTRPTRAEKVLLPTLRHLNEAGIEDSAITIVIAKGMRERLMTIGELKAKIGEEAMERLTVEQHNCSKDLVDFGVNASGTPVLVCRTVAEAQLKVGMGRIVPHEMAGYSGGAKIVLPGVSGRKTVASNHSMVMRLAEISDLCGRNEQNPIREDMEEAARKVKLDFTIDQVTDRKNQIVKIAAGDFVEAHREGSRAAQQIYSASVAKKADVLLMSPEERGKTVEEFASVTSALRLVKKDGVVIMIAPCNEGLGSEDFVRLCRGNDINKCKQEIKEKGWGSTGIAYLYLAGFRKHKLMLVSDLCQKEVNGLGIVATSSVAEAFEVAKSRMNGNVTFVPYGASILPIVTS